MRIENGFMVPDDGDSWEESMADFAHTHTCLHCGCFVHRNLTEVHRERCKESL